MWNCSIIYSGRNPWLVLAPLTTAMQTSTTSNNVHLSALQTLVLNISRSSLLGRQVPNRTWVAQPVWRKIKSGFCTMAKGKIALTLNCSLCQVYLQDMILKKKSEILWQFHLTASTTSQPCKWVALSVSVKWASHLQWPLPVNNTRQSYSANSINSQNFKRK